MKHPRATIIVAILCLVFVTECSPLPTPTAPVTIPSGLPTARATSQPTSPPNASAQSTNSLTPTELKYRLIAQFGKVFYCDPDLYPVARRLSASEFDRRIAQIEQDAEEYKTIMAHLSLAGTTTLSSDQKQQVYAESKMLNAITLKPVGDTYQFSLRVSGNGRQGFAIEGTIDAAGTIQVTKKQATVTTCPICLAGDTRIDTPNGPVAVRDLQVGMSVWTTDASGTRRAAVIVQTAKRPVPPGTLLVHATLDDGRALTAAAFHPTTDGRVIGDLARGDAIDGARVASVENVPIAGDATYDLLPSGETGAYWANGILLKSTLAP